MKEKRTLLAVSQNACVTVYLYLISIRVTHLLDGC